MIWFSSDHHFGHFNVIRYCNRPYQGTAEMNEDLINKWNSTISKEDIVYYLGDFSLSKSALPIVSQLNGIKHLIPGNHDHCHPAYYKKDHKRADKERLYIDAGFASINVRSKIVIGNEEVLLSHLPYIGDCREERYSKHRPKDEGQWLIHGHVHQLWKQKEKMINVGVDVWGYFPVSIEEIEKIINSRS